MTLYKLLCGSLMIITLFTFSECKKNKPGNPVDQLPSETQYGAGTFGCLVDGKPFIPKGDPFGGPIKSCAYQFVGGGYSFQLSASDKSTPTIYSIGLSTDSLKIREGMTIELQNSRIKGMASGFYLKGDVQTFDIYSTSKINIGELKIKKLDEINRIVSGTFWFDAVNDMGVKAQVREGRFDMKYTL